MKSKDNKKRTNPIMSVVVIVLLTLTSTGLSAQGTSALSFWDDPFNSPMLIVVMVLGLLAVTIVLMIFLAFYLYRVMSILTHEADVDRAKRLGIAVTVKPNWFEQWW